MMHYHLEKVISAIDAEMKQQRVKGVPKLKHVVRFDSGR